MISVARPKHFILALVALLLALTTSLALAQEPLTQSDSIENLTISFPAGWVSDVVNGSLTIANSAESLEASNQDDPIPATGIVLSLALPSNLEDIGLPLDATPEDILNTLADLAGATPDIMTIEPYEYEGGTGLILVTSAEFLADTPVISFSTPNGSVTLLLERGEDALDAASDAVIAQIVGSIVLDEAIAEELPPAPTPEVATVPFSTTFGLGTVSVELPIGWEAEYDDFGGVVYIANSAALMEKFQANDTTYTEGDILVTILSGTAQSVETLAPVEALRSVIGEMDANAEISEDDTFGFPAARSVVVNSDLPAGSAELFAVQLPTEMLILVVQPGGEIDAMTDALLHSVVYEDNSSTESNAQVALATTTPTPAGTDGKPTAEPVTPSVSGDATLAYGDSVVGTISRRENQQLFTFTGTAGDVVTITMIADDSNELDTRLYLFTADGFEAGESDLVNNDDSSDATIGTSSARIASFVLPEDGDYLIQATAFRGTGDYTLTLEETVFELNNPEVALVYGDTVTGNLTDENAPTLWQFEGTEGDVVTITMVALSSTALDTRLALYTTDDFTGSANAVPLVENDDSGDFVLGYTNARLLGFTLPVTGEYVIEANRFFGTGLYTLTLENVVISIPEDAETIAYGDTVTGTLTNSALEQIWLFEGTAGDIVTITMLAEDDDELDSKVYLYNPAGYSSNIELINNDDAFGGDVEFPNSQIVEFELPSTDTYIIKASSFSVNDIGDYTLILESANASVPGTTSDAKPTTVPATTLSDEVRQWASSASGTSQYGSSSYSFMQATGAPDTNACGDYSTAWASLTSTGKDTLIVEFAEAVIPTQINIYQTYTPGSIIRVEVGSTEISETIQIEDSADAPGNTECPGVFTLDISGIDFPVNQVSIVLDQTIGGGWNEIDAVELVGTR